MDIKNKLLHDEDVEYQTSEEVVIYPNFESMGLKEELIRGKEIVYSNIRCICLWFR
jgi:hypothetical protein